MMDLGFDKVKVQKMPDLKKIVYSKILSGDQCLGGFAVGIMVVEEGVWFMLRVLRLKLGNLLKF